MDLSSEGDSFLGEATQATVGDTILTQLTTGASAVHTRDHLPADAVYLGNTVVRL